MINYQQLISEQNISSIDVLYKFFWDEIATLWANEYEDRFPKHGEISLQNFLGFAFLIDLIWPDFSALDHKNELPETRVISFFGISNTNIVTANRSRMKQGWGKHQLLFLNSDQNMIKAILLHMASGDL